jgi:activator of HSP90 ATPase
LKKWPTDHHARVTIKLTFGDGKTTAKTSVSGAPVDDAANLEQAFEHFYWQRIQGVFGYR